LSNWFLTTGKSDSIEEYSLLNKWYWNHWSSIGKKLTSNLNLIPYIKISSKQMIDAKVKLKMMKHLEERVGEKPLGLK
jgi:hypothetical protein